MFTGVEEVGVTVPAGFRLHVAFASVVLQVTLTAWLKDPAAVTWKETGVEVDPRPAFTLDGDGAVNPKLTK